MSAHHDPINILMVDDQPAKLLSYEVILKGLGANLIKANSAREALERLGRPASEGSLVVIAFCWLRKGLHRFGRQIQDHGPAQDRECALRKF